MRPRLLAGLTAATTALLLATSTPALAGPPVRARDTGGQEVRTTGLDGPFGLAQTRGGLLVAESVTGEVTLVGRRGGQRVVVRDAQGVAGVASHGRWAWSVIGGPSETGEPVGGAYGPAKVLRTNLRTGRTSVIADLLAHELRANPDGQQQLVDGKPVDALSNPFSMAWSPRGLLVADGGANAVLRVDPRTGRTTTFFVPPNVTDVQACLAPDAQANPGSTGCDSVPTGVDVRGGRVYVSTLGSERPGAGRIYQLGLRTGKVQRVWSGLDSPTGVAAGRRGTIYYSQVLFGAAPDAAPDPATLGRVVRVGRRGSVSAADVRMPTGLEIKGGELYTSAFSIAHFFGQQSAGQVVRLRPSAFR